MHLVLIQHLMQCCCRCLRHCYRRCHCCYCLLPPPPMLPLLLLDHDTTPCSSPTAHMHNCCVDQRQHYNPALCEQKSGIR
jgi:hypothetical protein